MAEHPQELRLWLRLLTCTQLIEQTLRSRLRSQFETTLPRFDLMAQLERSPGGLKITNTIYRSSQNLQSIKEAYWWERSLRFAKKRIFRG